MAIGFSAVACQLLFSHNLTLCTLYTFLGVFLLSGAASALNQYQERFIDAKMGRTLHRPLPSGEMSPVSALSISVIFGLAGFSLLFFGTTRIAAFLGIFNLLCYNLVYTPLKRKYSITLLIGAVTGAVPPVIGWCASGGYIFDSTILPVVIFMYLWQIPHFWLILFKYSREYENAGFGPLLYITRGGNKKAVLFIWILGTSASTVLFPYFQIVTGISLIAILLSINVFIIYFFYKFLYNSQQTIKLRSAFGTFYLYQMIILVIILISSVIY
jgi:protoheme IX farnesyltransferase